MYPREYALGMACLDHLSLVRQDYTDLIRRCAPLSDRTKQILEINEEDHGKAIMVFTVVTVIFLPLSFVTSYFGMNASDIRDMNETQAVFWSVAIPLTCVTVGSCLLIGYNGDSIRDLISDMYRKMMRKERDIVEASGITVSQRQGPSKSKGGLDSVFDSFGPADELPSRRRDLHRADYNYDDYDDDWYEKEDPKLLDKYNTPTYPSGAYPPSTAPKRGDYYPTPTPLAIQARRQSLYPYPYSSDRKSSRNEYDKTPYMPYKDVARDRPRRTGTTKSRHANSTNPFSPINSRNPFDPYVDDGLSLPPPPRRMPTNETTTRRRETYYDDGDDVVDEPDSSTHGGHVDMRSRYGRRGRSRSSSWIRTRSQSRGRDWSYEREPVRRVHYARGSRERIRPRNPYGDFDSYAADRVSGRPRRRREQEYERREEGSRRYPQRFQRNVIQYN